MKGVLVNFPHSGSVIDKYLYTKNSLTCGKSKRKVEDASFMIFNRDLQNEIGAESLDLF